MGQPLGYGKQFYNVPLEFRESFSMTVRAGTTEVLSGATPNGFGRDLHVEACEIRQDAASGGSATFGDLLVGGADNGAGTPAYPLTDGSPFQMGAGRLSNMAVRNVTAGNLTVRVFIWAREP